ncbi:MAG: hypothetical protein WA802_04360 [Terracidiphilus sp.]
MQRTVIICFKTLPSYASSHTILRVVDYWYSPALDVNLKVVRHDPRDGDQTLWLTNISTTAADPATFKAPPSFQVYDRRTPKPIAPSQTSQR